ncbi:replication initiation protein [Acinetobacter sp. B10A]|uniref:replication initiation protein RepM n=1 Tax=Acinetobacter baretiae TaxID=2605383 RepID=UPI001B3C5D6D|nr:replication initiation protein RepM [Acinetobacter baretiae]MBF7686406.1 replication initiation protein [Acinetobacter baretiae]
MVKNELVVKDNALINASYNLEVTEQRLILLSIIRARETGEGITAESKLEIHASEYANRFNVTKEAAYYSLKSAVANLFNRQFSYNQQYKNTNKIETVKSRWVSSISYVDDLAILRITFAPEVVPLITKLEKHFTSYQLKQVTQLTSKYAIRLYEILIAWRELGKTPVLNMEDIRFKLGLEPGDYPRIDTFKKRVLEPAIEQINSYTDIETSYEQFKEGRTISSLRFYFKEKLIQKNVSIPKSEDNFLLKISQKQIDYFANKLAHDDVFASSYAEVGESYIDLEKRLLLKLSNPKFVEKNIHHLIRLGFRM